MELYKMKNMKKKKKQNKMPGKVYSFITSASRAGFQRRLFVCYQDYAKTTQPIFTEYGGKVA